MREKSRNTKQAVLYFLLITVFGFVCVGYTDTSRPILATNTGSFFFIFDTLSYWDILLYLAGMFLVVFVAYIIYLTKYVISNDLQPYYFNKPYTVAGIVAYLEELESHVGKKFPLLKSFIMHLEKNPTNSIRKHAEIIDSILLCIKFNGRSRWHLFWYFADPMLKIMILSLPLIAAMVILLSYIYFGLAGLLLSFLPVIVMIPVIIISFSGFLSLVRYIFRKNENYSPAFNLAFIALEALINTHVSRSRNKKTGEHFYYTEIHKYNSIVNAQFAFSDIYLPTSSDLYGDLNSMTIGEKTELAKKH